jgi:hypothetical protein
MKKLLILLSCILIGCKPVCILSQIPPQFISPSSGCTATLPNYLSKISATDNCSISTFTQTPTPGYLLTAINTTTNVTIKATDVSGNFRQIVFSVTLKDTTKPVFIIDPTLTYTYDSVTKAYNRADQMIAIMMQKQGLIRPMGTYNKADSLRYWKQEGNYQVIAYPRPAIDFYKNKALLIYVSPGFALTGKGHRVTQFIEPQDSCKVLNKFN